MAKAKESKTAAGRFAYEGLERAIHEKARLGIMTSLMTRPEGLSFNELKELCDLTDGNLNRHLEVLSEAGLVVIRKEEGSGRGRTLCKITPSGRTRFKEYLEELERVIADAAAASAAGRLATT
jgi:DNA-binding MarR family transcriptional regulator